MKSRICLAALTSFLLAGCQSMPTIRMLEERAGYEKDADIQLSLGEGAAAKKDASVAFIYLHPHETSAGSYFHGGFISVKLDESLASKEHEPVLQGPPL